MIGYCIINYIYATSKNTQFLSVLHGANGALFFNLSHNDEIKMEYHTDVMLLYMSYLQIELFKQLGMSV